MSAYNGHGPWWNAGASHMHAAVPTAALRRWGLLSLVDEQRRFQGFVNRRMPNGTSGGVGAGREQSRLAT